MPAERLTQARILAFWAPLAATWLMMACEQPLLAALIARLRDPEINLAAHGVAFAFALIVEAPVIMMMSASTALVRDRDSFVRLRRFTHGLNAAVTAAMLLLLVPPVFAIVVEGWIGLPADVSRLTYIALALLLPWPGAIGFRRFYQGVLIRSGLTRYVAYGTVIRLVAMSGTAVLLFAFGNFEGVVVGSLALSAGVLVEAVASWLMARRPVRELPPTSPTEGATERLGTATIWRFYYPLVLTSVLTLGVHPVVTFFVGRARDPIESLAVLPVIGGLVFIFRALGLAYQEVGIALIGEKHENYVPLRRFTATLGFSVCAVLGLIAWTPFADFWFITVSGLSPELAAFAIVPTRILVIIPGLTVLITFQRAMAVNYRATGKVSWATLIEVLGVIVVLIIGINLLDITGAVVAAAALVLGRLAANLYLVPPLLRLRRRNGDVYEKGVSGTG